MMIFSFHHIMGELVFSGLWYGDQQFSLKEDKEKREKNPFSHLKVHLETSGDQIYS